MRGGGPLLRERNTFTHAQRGGRHRVSAGASRIAYICAPRYTSCIAWRRNGALRAKHQYGITHQHHCAHLRAFACKHVRSRVTVIRNAIARHIAPHALRSASPRIFALISISAVALQSARRRSKAQKHGMNMAKAKTRLRVSA